MNCNKRTDTSHGCPAVQRREHKEHLKGYQSRINNVKSSIDTRAPTSQPHLTLYGRDYATKKKATTEAAFADLKMIQAIARTMTRKHAIAERKGPVSLNSDARKQEIYRVMQENHRLLDGIDSVHTTFNTQDMINEHKNRQRYVINSSHTARHSGDYEGELDRIKREDMYKHKMQSRSVDVRREAASRLGKSTGSVSLPSLTVASSTEPATSAQCKMPVKKNSAPSKNWTAPGEANIAEQKRQKQQAKPGRPREPAMASPARSSEPSSTVAGPKPAVRFAMTSPEPEPPYPILSEEEEEQAEDRIPTPLQRAMRQGPPSVETPVKAPQAEEPQEDLEEAEPWEVEPKPAEPLREEPPTAEREDAELAEAMLPPPGQERQVETMPPAPGNMPQAEPQLQEPVICDMPPEQPHMPEADGDQDALGQSMRSAADTLRSSGSMRSGRSGRSSRGSKGSYGEEWEAEEGQGTLKKGGTYDMDFEPYEGTGAFQNTGATSGNRSLTVSGMVSPNSKKKKAGDGDDEFEAPSGEESYNEDEEAFEQSGESKSSGNQAPKPRSLEPSPFKDEESGVEEGVRPNSRAKSPPAGFQMDTVNFERALEKTSKTEGVDQGQEEYEDEYEDDYAEDFAEGSQEPKEASATFEDDDGKDDGKEDTFEDDDEEKQLDEEY